MAKAKLRATHATRRLADDRECDLLSFISSFSGASQALGKLILPASLTTFPCFLTPYHSLGYTETKPPTFPENASAYFRNSRSNPGLSLVRAVRLLLHPDVVFEKPQQNAADITTLGAARSARYGSRG